MTGPTADNHEERLRKRIERAEQGLPLFDEDEQPRYEIGRSVPMTWAARGSTVVKVQNPSL